MNKRTLGQVEVSEQGLGCMGMTFGYAPSGEDEAVATIRRAVEMGITYFDTADMYGPYTNETLLGKALGSDRDNVVVGSKVGNEVVDGQLTWQLNGRPEYIAASIDGTLQRLGTDHVDLYYLHRVDPQVPVEESVGAMAELVTAGKVRALGLSEVGADTLRRAHAVHPISAVQSEYSLVTRDVEELGVTQATQELGVGLVAYSPIGRGMLSGSWTVAERGERDFRHIAPRFNESNLQHNLSLVDRVTDIAGSMGVTTSQIAIAWVLAQGEHVVALPGTKRVRYLEENIAASEIELTPEQVASISSALDPAEVRGTRYPEREMPVVNA